MESGRHHKISQDGSISYITGKLENKEAIESLQNAQLIISSPQFDTNKLPALKAAAKEIKTEFDSKCSSLFFSLFGSTEEKAKITTLALCIEYQCSPLEIPALKDAESLITMLEKSLALNTKIHQEAPKEHSLERGEVAAYQESDSQLEKMITRLKDTLKTNGLSAFEAELFSNIPDFLRITSIINSEKTDFHSLFTKILQNKTLLDPIEVADKVELQKAFKSTVFGGRANILKILIKLGADVTTDVINTAIWSQNSGNLQTLLSSKAIQVTETQLSLAACAPDPINKEANFAIFSLILEKITPSKKMLEELLKKPVKIKNPQILKTLLLKKADLEGENDLHKKILTCLPDWLIRSIYT